MILDFLTALGFDANNEASVMTWILGLILIMFFAMIVYVTNTQEKT